MKTTKVHFSLGSNLGNVLTDIAREKLLYEFNPQEAIRTFTAALINFPEELAKNILVGKQVLKVVGNEMEVVPYIPDPDQNKNFYLFEHIEKQYMDMLNDCDEYYNALYRFYTNNGEDSDITVTLSVSEFISAALEDEAICIEDMPEYQFMKATKLFIEKSVKFVDMVKWCYDTYGDDYIGAELSKFPYRLTRLINAINYLKVGSIPPEWKTKISRMHLMQDKLDQFLVATTDNERRLIVEEGLRPTGPDEYFDGGWLSPKGEFYGLNGTFANFIHVAIADNLKAHKRIPDDGDSPDLWLENNGWVKLHYDQVHFTPTVSGKKFPNFITEAQQTFLKKWAKNHHNGVLKFGYRFEQVPYTKFGSMDAHMMTLLFR